MIQSWWERWERAAGAESVQPFLEVESGPHRLEGGSQLDHRERDIGLDPDDDGLGATEPGPCAIPRSVWQANESMTSRAATSMITPRDLWLSMCSSRLPRKRRSWPSSSAVWMDAMR